MKNVDLVIIGGGPAGLTAALYAGRAGLSVVVIEKGAPGGKMNNTHKIDNYPGLASKPGFEYSQTFLAQAIEFGAEVVGGEVTKTYDLESSDQKHVELANGEIYETKAVIIASGLKARKLDVPGFDTFFGKGVSTCLVCDGAFFRGKHIAVVGGGNAATEETLYASNIVEKVHIINHFPSFACEKATLDSLNKLENLEVHHNSDVVSINGTDKVESITFTENGEEKTIPVEGVFTYVGWDVENTFLSNVDIFDEHGFVNADPITQQTSIPGVYAAGDIVPKPVRQVTIAAGEGTKAALAAIDYINKLN